MLGRQQDSRPHLAPVQPKPLHPLGGGERHAAVRVAVHHQRRARLQRLQQASPLVRAGRWAVSSDSLFAQTPPPPPTHLFSHRLAENRRWTAASSASPSGVPLRYAFSIWPTLVVRSGNRHSSAGTPAALRAVTKRAHCVLLPLLSVPSKTMKAPRGPAIWVWCKYLLCCLLAAHTHDSGWCAARDTRSVRVARHSAARMHTAYRRATAVCDTLATERTSTGRLRVTCAAELSSHQHDERAGAQRGLRCGWPGVYSLLPVSAVRGRL